MAELLGVELTTEQRVIAAADHNLTAAYAGQVPGVTREAVLELRSKELCGRYRMSPEKVAAGIRATATEMAEAPKVELGGVNVADLRSLELRPFATEAATMGGQAALAFADSRDATKLQLVGASAPAIEAFLGQEGWAAKNGLTNVYGVPTRGFAGGNVPA